MRGCDLRRGWGIRDETGEEPQSSADLVTSVSLSSEHREMAPKQRYHFFAQRVVSLLSNPGKTYHEGSKVTPSHGAAA